MMRRVTLRAVLAEATDTGLVPPDVEPSVRAALQQASQDDMPWYLRLLMGGAAWIAALFLLGTGLGLVSLAVGDRVDVAALVLGLALMPAGLALRKAGAGELRRQASLVCVVAGQLLFGTALGSLSDSTLVTAAGVIVSTTILIALFDEPAYRFGGAMAVVVAVLVIALELQLRYALGLVTVITAAVPLVVWRVVASGNSGGNAVWPSSLVDRQLDPVAWSCVVTTCLLLSGQAAIDAVTGSAGYPRSLVALLLPAAWPLTAAFVLMVVWLAVRIVRDHHSAPTEPVPMALIGATVALGLLTSSTPAVCGALLFVILGFDRRRAGVVVVGATFLMLFLGLHYYSLSLSLLQKSAVLMTSGALCLAMAAWLRRRLVGARA